MRGPRLDKDRLDTLPTLIVSDKLAKLRSTLKANTTLHYEEFTPEELKTIGITPKDSVIYIKKAYDDLGFSVGTTLYINREDLS